jgi:hypothetical protein
VVRDIGPLSGDNHRAFTGGVFVGHQVLLNVGFGVARARLTNLLHSHLLLMASEDVYGAAVARLAQVGPPGPAEPSKLVRVQTQAVVTGAKSATLALRWQANAPAGGLFPALDADIRLAPAGDQTTLLTLDGAYRLPPGAAGAGLDQAVVQQAATVAVHDLLDRMAAAITGPPGKATGTEPELSQRSATDERS